ncbi:MAG: ankyrin repeat domain-containing protein [Alphaproteobacteria bacterium]|nr:ankyrin repeat domain-containing protein [Alphaproteobacteria bacterium]
MVQPPHPWPEPPPRNHMHFHPEGMHAAYLPHRGGADLFFCHGLEPKSPQAKMMEAVARHDTAQLNALIALNPQVPPDFQNANGVTLLMVAAARNNTDALHALANHPLVNLSQQSRDGWTALHYAAHFGNGDCVAALLKRQADFKILNNAGESPLALAADAAVQDIFWAHKAFVHYMKRAEPNHPHLSPPPPAPEPEQLAAEEKPAVAAPKSAPAKPADMSLTALFLRAALNVGLSTSAAEGVYERLKADITEGRSDTLPDAYDRIEQAAQEAYKRKKDITFDWDGLLGVAAAAGNIPALTFIAKKRDYMDSKPLTAALANVIAQGKDSPQTAEAVQWLLRWGADANASGKPIYQTGSKAGTLAYQAFVSRKPKIFEAICLQAGVLKTWHVSPDQLKWEQKVEKIFAEQFSGKADPNIRPVLDARGEAVALLKMRGLLDHMGHEKLTAHFDDALARTDLRKMMAVYAETRTKHLLRGTFAVPPELGARAIALALTHGRTDFAKRLEADGHTLNNLRGGGYSAEVARLEKTGSDAVRTFIRMQKSGAKTAPDILSIDDKYTLLRGAAARLPVSGRGFGF